MARSSRRLQLPSVAAALLFLALLPLVARAQLSSVPDLSTATQTSDKTTATSPQTTGRTTQQTTGGNTQNTDQSSAFQLTGAPQLSTSNGNGLATATNNLGTSAAVHLTGLPTIAGAGIPDLVIPYTAGAPFMQKSSLPEGTFFIAVGATLAFCGACVLLWRLMVAWSVNRSVKRTAMLASSYGGSEKAGRTTSSYWGGSTMGYNRMASSGGPGKTGSFYKDPNYDSTVTLDTLTASGKPLKPPHFRDSAADRSSPSSNLPPNLFFSPTAQAASQRDSAHIQQNQHRNSGYMPSGYYASPSSQAAGGNSAIAIGGNLAPGSYGNPNRHSAITLNNNPSPPASPSLPPHSRGTNVRYSTQSRDSYAHPASRDGLRAPASRDGLTSARSSTAFLGAMPSSSSLGVAGASGSEAGTVSRAPSAYLEELFDNHGSGPRERF